MNKAILNAEEPEVVLPEDERSAEEAEITSPQDNIDYDNMSDEEFDEYLNKAYNGELDEVTAEPAGAGAEDIAEETPTASESEKMPFKTFATEEEYNTDRQNFFNEHIGNRLKGARENSDLLNRLKELAVDYYGDTEDPIKALTEDLENQNAARAGTSREKYVEMGNDRRDALAYREQQRQMQDEENKRNDIISKWKTAEERLKQSVPNFDFSKAMENPEFHDMIMQGADVGEAYYAIKLAQLENSAKQNNRQPVSQNAQMKGTKPGSGVNNAMSMNDTDFRKYLNDIMNEGR